MKPAIAFSVAFGKSLECVGRCEACFRAWHPEIPFFIFSHSHYRLLFGVDVPASMHELVCVRALVGFMLAHEFERVIYLDADAFPLSPLEEFLDFPGDAALTSDAGYFTMDHPELPMVNSGILAARGTDFWLQWLWSSYAFLVPFCSLVGLDQFVLRLLAQSHAASCHMVPEVANRRLLNALIYSQPGKYRYESGKLFKGDNEVAIYHQAGPDAKTEDKLPPQVREALHDSLRRAAGIVAPPFLFETLAHRIKTPTEQQIRNLFETIPSWILRIPTLMGPVTPDTDRIYITAAPACWDDWRTSHKERFWRSKNGSTPMYYLKPGFTP